jgi:hypothetical protein
VGDFVSLGAELNFVAAGMEPPSAFRIRSSRTVAPVENENAMPIAFGNELNSSIDQDEVVDPRRRADRAMVPQGQPRWTRQKSSAAEREHVTHRVLENIA